MSGGLARGGPHTQSPRKVRRHATVFMAVLQGRCTVDVVLRARVWPLQGVVDPFGGLPSLSGRRAQLRLARAPQVEGREGGSASPIAAVVAERDFDDAAGFLFGRGLLRSNARGEGVRGV